MIISRLMAIKTECSGCKYAPVAEKSRQPGGLVNKVGEVTNAQELLAEMKNGQGYRPEVNCARCVQGLMAVLDRALAEAKRVERERERWRLVEKRRTAASKSHQ